MTTDLTVITNGPASIESYARDLESKLQIADLLLKSGMIPSHYKTREAVLTAVLYGQELGFSPIRALNSIVVIQGKAALEAQALKALAIAHGGIVETVRWTDTECTLKCTRGTWSETATYLLDDAAKAGLVNKDNWRRMPKAMLYARAVSILVRNMFADILGGLYSRQEIEDGVTVEAVEVAEPKRSQKGAKKTPEHVIDDAPEFLGPPTADPLAELRNAIDGEDWLAVGAWEIKTKCSLQGMTVRDAVLTKRETAIANLKRFKEEGDRLAVRAFADAFPPLAPVDFSYEEETPNV